MMAVEFYSNNIVGNLPYQSQSSPGSVDSFSSADNDSVIVMPPPAYGGSENNYLKKLSNEENSVMYDVGLYEPYENSLSRDEKNKSEMRPTSLNISDPSQGLQFSITTPELINMLKEDDIGYEQMLNENFLQSTGNYSEQVNARDADSRTPPNKRQTQKNTHVAQNTLYCPDQTNCRSFPSNHLSCATESRVEPLASQYVLSTEHPQVVPILTDSAISPINMQKQEIIKNERKRMRNRVAATKCRKRKLERISRLEEKVVALKQQNVELSSNAGLLRQQVADLKSKVMSHVNSGCHLMTSQLAF